MRRRVRRLVQRRVRARPLLMRRLGLRQHRGPASIFDGVVDETDCTMGEMDDMMGQMNDMMGQMNDKMGEMDNTMGAMAQGEAPEDEAPEDTLGKDRAHRLRGRGQRQDGAAHPHRDARSRQQCLGHR